MNQPQLLKLLSDFSAAWNSHDVDALMLCMHPDCVFETVAGDAVYGTQICGFAAVKQAFAQTFITFPDAQWLHAQHWLSADAQRGVSESTFKATTADGRYIEANMVDIFSFKDGKILIKNALRKNRPLQDQQAEGVRHGAIV